MLVVDVLAAPAPADAAPVETRRPRPRFPCFDGYRALAALAVLLVHVTFISGFTFRHHLGYYTARLDVGVSLFFLISGFLLYRPFVSANVDGRTAPALGPYLRRRALRIIPAYWLALTIIAFVLHDATIRGPKDALIYYGFAQIYAGGSHLGGGITQAWSLDTELSFYLFLPAWALFMRWLSSGRRGSAVRRELVGVVALYATGLAVRAALLEAIFSRRTGVIGALYWLPSTIDLFALGMGLAVVSVWVERRPEIGNRIGRRPWVWWTAAAAAYWLMATRLGLRRDLGHLSITGWTTREVFYGLFALLVLVPGVFGPQQRGGIRRLLQLRPLQLLGVVSYGIYLWHNNAIDEFRKRTHTHEFSGNFKVMLAFVLVASIAVAAASYLVVERPALRLKRPTARRRRPAASNARLQTRLGGQITTIAPTLRRAGPLALAGVAANGANVIVTVVIAHLLSSRAYGSLTQLIALFLVLNMPGSALLVAVVRRVASWNATAQQDRVKAWIATVRRRGLIVLAVWSVIAIVGRGWLATRLGLPTPSGVSEVLIAGGAWALLSVERGLIQSHRSYGRLAANLGVEALVRTVATVGLVAAGWGVEGAALAFVAAMAAALAHARVAQRGLDTTQSIDPLTASALVPGRHRLGVDLATALGALGLIAVLQNLDVLFVGRENPRLVGSYGAISVASKAVVFGAIVLCGYLLPEAVLRSHRGDHALHQLAVAAGLVAMPVAGLTLVAWAAPTPLLRLAFGSDKVHAAPAFATLALAMGGLAVTVLCTHYLLGVGNRRVIAVLAAGAAALVVTLTLAHGRPVSTARGELTVQAGLAIVLVALVLRGTRQQRPS